MALPVSLQEVVDTLQMQMDETAVYLHEETGEMLMSQEHERRRADRLAEDELDRDDLQDWEQDFLPKVREAMHDPSWLELPSQWDLHEYKMMETFCYSVENDEHRDQLLQAIRGSGAFRYFRDTADRLGLTEDWYAFRDQAYEDRAVEWLEAHDIPYVREEDDA